MKKLSSIITAASLISVLGGCAAPAAETQPAGETVIKVAVIKQLDHASLDEIANAITAELDVLSETNNVKIEYTVDSGQNDPTTLQQYAAQYVGGDVDVIIPIATLAAQTMVSAADGTDIPVVYAAISDPEAAGLTGLANVSGTSDALNTKQIMDMMFAMNPDIKTVGLLYSQSEKNSEKPIAEAKAYLDEKGITYVEKTGNTTDEVIQAVSALCAAKVDAVFTPTDNVVMAAELSIAETLADAGIPHYAGADSFVRNGAFATCGVNYTDLGTRTADLAYEAAISGTGKLEDYYLMDGGIITVNTETAQKLNLTSYADVFKTFGELVEVTTSEE